MMARRSTVAAACLLLMVWSPGAHGQGRDVYPWLRETDGQRTVAGQIPAPRGFERIRVEEASFADWLRHLPLKPEGTPVCLFNGERKADQSVHAAVLDIDTGSRDLQQCADAVIRLRAEYLYAAGAFDGIRFNFTSGHAASYERWRSGFRPEVKGDRVRWVKTSIADSSYPSFRQYLDTVFMYAGTHSLSQELQPRERVAAMEVGDVFVRGGSPGHAVIVIDMAERRETGEIVFLLAQGFMPAQDIHILRNPHDRDLSPWYSAKFGETLRTPDWDFAATELRRFMGNRK